MGRDDVETDYVTSPSTSDLQEEPKQPLEVAVDLSKYELGKPRRVLIRAKITHGDASKP